MAQKVPDFETVRFDDVAAVIQEADDIGVLLRGHLWIEVLLEYAARTKLARPEAIDWGRARFEQKVALAEAVGALAPDLSAAVRELNRLRNRFAHELVFAVTEADAKGVTERVQNSRIREGIEASVESQLEIKREIDKAVEAGYEIDIDPALEWYPRVMTETRARLFAFVIVTVRELAMTCALESMTAEGREVTALLAHLDSTLQRLTGGLFKVPRKTVD